MPFLRPKVLRRGAACDLGRRSVPQALAFQGPGQPFATRRRGGSIRSDIGYRLLWVRWRHGRGIPGCSRCRCGAKPVGPSVLRASPGPGSLPDTRAPRAGFPGAALPRVRPNGARTRGLAARRDRMFGSGRPSAQRVRTAVRPRPTGRSGRRGPASPVAAPQPPSGEVPGHHFGGPDDGQPQPLDRHPQRFAATRKALRSPTELPAPESSRRNRRRAICRTAWNSPFRTAASAIHRPARPRNNKRRLLPGAGTFQVGFVPVNAGTRNKARLLPPPDQCGAP